MEITEVAIGGDNRPVVDMLIEQQLPFGFDGEFVVLEADASIRFVRWFFGLIKLEPAWNDEENEDYYVPPGFIKKRKKLQRAKDLLRKSCYMRSVGEA